MTLHSALIMKPYPKLEPKPEYETLGLKLSLIIARRLNLNLSSGVMRNPNAKPRPDP